MPQLIKTIDDFFYEKKCNIYVLHIKKLLLRGDEGDRKIEKQHLDWFSKNNVKYECTCTSGFLCGWNGMYYIDFDGHDDPKIKKYSKKFETDDGKSVEPEKYQLYCMEYDKWVTNGGLENYKKTLDIYF